MEGQTLKAAVFRVFVLAVSVCASAGCALCSSDEQAPSAPNVILISIDALRADHLNCYGYGKHATSPHMDALARDGVLFETCIAASPWTTPSHMSMLTSLHPSSHGVTDAFQKLMAGLSGRGTYNGLADEPVTLAEAFKSNGYVTGAFTAGVTLDPKIGFGQGFDFYDMSMYKLVDENMRELGSWIRNQHDKPFFLFFHNFEVHAPYLSTAFIKELVGLEVAKSISVETNRMLTAATRDSVSPARDLASKPVKNLHAEFTSLLKKHGVMNRDVCQAMYAGSVRSADRWIGWLVKLLKELKIYSRTLIVLTSDHGEEFAERKETDFYDQHGHTLYEELVHVPLVFKLPHQHHKGTRIENLACTIDIMPTILEVVSARDRPAAMQGISLRQMWESESPSADAQRRCFIEATATLDEQKGIRTKQYKYIERIRHRFVNEHGRHYLPPKPSEAEMYNIRNDRMERENLIGKTMTGEHLKAGNWFASELRIWKNAQKSRTKSVDIQATTIDQLKALGYIEQE